MTFRFLIVLFNQLFLILDPWLWSSLVYYHIFDIVLSITNLADLAEAPVSHLAQISLLSTWVLSLLVALFQQNNNGYEFGFPQRKISFTIERLSITRWCSQTSIFGFRLFSAKGCALSQHMLHRMWLDIR